MNLLAQIKESLATLPAAEERVAQLVLRDAHHFANTPVAELSKLAQVSDPTVVRFCRRFGYKGLSDFRLGLASSLAEGVPFVHTAVQASDGAQAVISKVSDNAINALMNFRNAAPAASLERAVQALTRSIRAGGRIEFYGVGNSGIVAQDAQHKFFRLGCSTVAYADGHLQIMAATLLRQQDCVVIISNSGRSRDLLDAADVARQQQACVIAITASGSPLSQSCDIFIAADHAERYDYYSPMISRLMHLLIVDILTTGVALELGEQLTPKLAAIKRNLRSKRYRA